MKPYKEQKIGNIIRRTFSNLVESEELVWHRDREDRIVIPLNENDWMVQFDNELPKKLKVNEEFFIPKNTFHRVIKGSGDLMVEIIETKFDDDLVVYEAIEEGKNKKGKKDACYYKVKSRYSVWPSAYGSGSLVQCRKVGAANWGNKTNESEDEAAKTIIEKIKSYKIPFKQFNERMKTEWIPMWKIDYDDNLADINENVARHLLYQISNDLVGGVEEIEFKNKSKNPTNHFQMVMYLGDLILWTSPFIYVNDKHQVVAKNTQIKILNSDYDDIAILKEDSIEENWSEKYKRSIDCNNPKGFSQRAHCQGRKKTNESEDYTKELINLAHSTIIRKKGKDYAPDVHELQAWVDEYLSKNKEVNEAKKTDFSKEKEQGLHGWFARQGGEGKSQGWVDCNTCRTDKETGRKKCKPCGRQGDEVRAKYPACRPTPSACGTPKKGKSWGKKSNNESFNMGLIDEKMVLSNYESYAEMVAQAYINAPDFDQSVVPSYKALMDSTKKLFKQLQSKLKVEFVDYDPYESRDQMNKDVKETGVLKITSLYNDHPLYTKGENLMLRAVHDYYTHIIANQDFGLRGELRAYNTHAKLAPPAALPALFTEIVGQVCYAIVYGDFTKQKICKLDGFDYKNVGKIENIDIVKKELQLNKDENLSISENLSIFEPKNIIKNMLRETFREDDIMTEPAVAPVIKPKESPKTAPVEPVKQPSRKDKPFLPMPNVQPDPKAKK